MANTWYIRNKYPVMLRIILFILILNSSVVGALGQNVEIKANKTPLNKIFIDLRNRYNIQFSFDDQLLSKYSVTVSGNYASAEEAIRILIKNLPLSYQKRDEVFVIIPVRTPEKKENQLFAGQILEKGTNEPLPFSHISLNDRVMATDIKGSFSALLPADSAIRVKISHLGHFVLDTVTSAGPNHQFFLIPASIGLREIVVKDKSLEKSTQIGDWAGAMKINHQVARFLPGNDDNSVFNFMRLQPGILASSEQSNGLMIWGSYEGQSKILFDNFTIWGLKSFNDDISTINPLMAKDIEIFKGGYDARYGDRVGGIVHISGKNGNTVKPSFSLNVNNVTMNSIVEIPVLKNSSLLLSFRQTYYNLYDGKETTLQDEESADAELPRRLLNNRNYNVTVSPDYTFHDANVKFSTKSDKGDLFYISLFGGEDQFDYRVNQKRNISNYTVTNDEKNRQSGASLFYGKTWKNGNSTNFNASYSDLVNTVRDMTEIKYNFQDQTILQRKISGENMISEYNINLDQWFTLNRSNRLETGAGFVMNDVSFVYKSFDVTQSVLNDQSPRANLFLQDHISLPGSLNFKIGLRADYPVNLEKIYWQPRVSASLALNDNLKFNAAWGIYNQFIAKSSVLDESGNYRYIWTSSDNTKVPVLEAQHWVAGTSYHKNNLTVSLESYLKNIDGLTRFIQGTATAKGAVYLGEGRSYGMDFYIKKDYHGHSAWIAYTLSRTEEKFAYFEDYQFNRAPQDQRHELKLAAIFDLKPFCLSGSYVFGSGFPINTGTLLQPEFVESQYNRLDLGLIYRFRVNKLYGEAGFAILNVFDTGNIRYSNFEMVPLDQDNSINIYSEAVPFSPRVSLKLSM